MLMLISLFATVRVPTFLLSQHLAEQLGAPQLSRRTIQHILLESDLQRSQLHLVSSFCFKEK